MLIKIKTEATFLNVYFPSDSQNDNKKWTDFEYL